MDATVENAETGLKSYNLVSAIVKNEENYYKPVVLTLVSTAEINVDKKIKTILLKPREEKKVNWLVNIKKTLTPGFIYTFPISVISDKNTKAETNFKAKDKGVNYNAKVFEEIIESDEKEETRTYSKYMKFNCEPDKNIAYVNSNLEITCNLENEGRQDLKDVQVCYDDNCETFDLDIGDRKTIYFEKKYNKPGLKNMIIHAETPEFIKTSYSRANIIDDSSVQLLITAPDNVAYGEQMIFEFALNRTSESIPQKLDIELHFQNAKQDWQMNSLERDSKFTITVSTQGFTFNNKFLVSVSYEDELGKKHFIEERHEIKLVDLDPLNWFIVGMNSLGYNILNWLS